MGDTKVHGYIHIYMGILNHEISFGDSRHPISIGDALLRFIYADIKSLDKRTHYTIEDFKSCHPYFTCCDPAWQAAFIAHLEHPHTPSPLPDIHSLLLLQQQYAMLLTKIFGQAPETPAQLAARLESVQWLRSVNCFARMSIHGTEGESGPVCMEDYFVSSLEECLYLELMAALKRRVIFKTCKNCGRFFIPRRANMDYCGRIYTPDGKTCSEVGYTQTFARNVKNDELLLAYTRAYKAHYARMTKPRKKTANMTRQEFEAWYQEAKRKLEEARAGLLDAEVFKAWLKK